MGRKRIRHPRAGADPWPLLLAVSFLLFSWYEDLLLPVAAGPLVLDCDPCVDRARLEIHAVVHGTSDDPVWQQSEKAMRQAAKDMGIAEFHLELRETFSSQAMADEIRGLVRYQLDDSPHGHNHNVPQIDALIVTIPDDIVKAAVNEAILAGIHVFGLNTGYQYAHDMGVLGWVAQNEYVAGQVAAREFDRRRLDAYEPARRALFVNHDEPDGALMERFRGFNDTLSNQFDVEVDLVFVDPQKDYQMSIELYDVFSTCLYDYVLLGGSETVELVADAFAFHQCGDHGDSSLEKDVVLANDTTVQIDPPATNITRIGPMMVGTFDGTQEVFDAIVAKNLEFALTHSTYLQSALPVILSAVYATTGKHLVLPNDRRVYNSGPHIVDIGNLPTDTYLACEEEAFPICDGGTDAESDYVGNCPCIDRTRIRIAGVVHGVMGDGFWETVFQAADQASFDMNIDLEVTQFPQQESEDILHRKMATKIRSLCGSGVSGIFVSMPSERVKEAVRFCKELRIPVVNINAGYEFALELDIQHIGQLERVAGREAGNRMLIGEVNEGYCLVPEPDNVAMIERCEGFKAVLLGANKTYGGSVEVPRDNQALYQHTVEAAVGDPDGNWDGIGLLVNGDIEPILALQWNHQSVALGTFDVRTNLFEPLNDGRLLFTIDQQQFLQGNMPVYLLTYAAYAKQELLNRAVETGPELVEYAPPEAEQVCELAGFAACAQIPEENFNFVSSSFLAWGYSALGLVCLVGLLSLVWMHVYRSKNIVQASQPLFLIFLVLGAVISMLSILPTGAQTTYRYLTDPRTGELTDEPNPDITLVDVSCMLAPWFYGVGFSIMFSALCAKIHRVKLIYEAGARMRRKKVEVWDVLSVMFTILAAEIAILLCWTFISRSKWERTSIEQDSDGYVLESVGFCSSEHHSTFLTTQFVFHAVCLLYAVLLCWQTSEIPTEFAEGSYISLSVLCIFQVAVLTIPIAYMVDDDPDVYYFVIGSSLFLQNFTVLCLIFFPKMWRVFTGDDQLPLPRATTHGIGSSAPTLRSHGTPTTPADVPIPTLVPTNQNSKPSSSLPSQPSFGESFRQENGISTNNASNQHGATNGYSNERNFVQKGAQVAQMLPLDSDSEGDDVHNEIPAEAIGIVTIAGALNHLKAGLDADSSSTSSSLADLPNSAQIVGPDNELADLAAEISRVEESRANVHSLAVGVKDIENGGVNKKPLSALPKRQFKRQDSPDVDSSVESSSLGYPGMRLPLVLSKMPGRNRNSPAVQADASSAADTKAGTGQHAGLPVTGGASLHEKNPQEGSHASVDNSSHKKDLIPIEDGHPIESESTSTAAASTTGITRAAASSVFRDREPSAQPRPPSTPIRLKKDPKAYGDNAALAVGITKARSSFLRKVAASYGSNSVASSIQRGASFGSKSTPLDTTPARPKKSASRQPDTMTPSCPTSSLPSNAAIFAAKPPPVDENHGFEAERQHRPHYAALKSSAISQEAGVDSPSQPTAEEMAPDYHFL